jgi:cytochrome oxidase Cu insertion factor (SCO1/SenC/PrrC family)
MKVLMSLLVLLALAAQPPSVTAQAKRSEKDFLEEKPAVGDPLPDLTVYAPDGKEVKTSSLRGHFVVLTFGCLT